MGCVVANVVISVVCIRKEMTPFLDNPGTPDNSHRLLRYPQPICGSHRRSNLEIVLSSSAILFLWSPEVHHLAEPIALLLALFWLLA